LADTSKLGKLAEPGTEPGLTVVRTEFEDAGAAKPTAGVLVLAGTGMEPELAAAETELAKS
jgi:hypothetical protein